ncbi:hypothetical protein HMPREF9193_01924 [Treponema lecithinolyticum ATCC 700332]|uniref:Uncharacterized protein n=1 Tax=Treponema lecithinolyticum ATCC 700332 TaxID=1321815 RepID=A0ABN0NWR0_TRELE|nr:hypothetical protein HMPREF9193_01924 [Treponema lecithinolyticum ATCC 700332]
MPQKASLYCCGVEPKIKKRLLASRSGGSLFFNLQWTKNIIR